MRIFRITVVALVLAALVAPATAAATGPPLDLQMIVPTVFSTGPDGEFEASGSAVSDGLVCASGETYTLDGQPSGFQSNRLVNISVLKEFVCNDGSGSFFVKLEVHYDFTKTPDYNVFNWTIQGGTEEYESLHGSGSGMGIYNSAATPPGGVLDVYEGKAH